MIGETILELLDRDQLQPPLEEIRYLWRLISYGTSSSVARYVELRNEQLRLQASREYSFIAHELRTPLMSASLSVDLIYHKVGRDTTLEEAFGRLRRAHHQLSEQIDSTFSPTPSSSRPPEGQSTFAATRRRTEQRSR